jgi:hypothetical protein
MIDPGLFHYSVRSVARLASFIDRERPIGYRAAPYLVIAFSLLHERAVMFSKNIHKRPVKAVYHLCNVHLDGRNRGYLHLVAGVDFKTISLCEVRNNLLYFFNETIEGLRLGNEADKILAGSYINVRFFVKKSLNLK